MTTSASAGTPADAFIEAARDRLSKSLAQIEHCLEQLPDDELYWRPFEGQNSPCNIMLHLGGNVRQWIISGVGGAVDVRERHREFDERTRVPRADLLGGLRDAVGEADAVLARLDPAVLTAARRIQGFETTVLAAILDTIAHFEGHAQEITYITRLRLEDRYVFRWRPENAVTGGRTP